MTITVQGSRIGVASATRDWYDFQWLITLGCTKHSEGCRYCSAATQIARSPSLQRFAQLRDGNPHNGNWTGFVETFPERLPTASQFAEGQKIFVDSASDLFHEKVPEPFLDAAFDAMSKSKATFGVLTKRSERLREYLRGRIVPRNIWVGVTVESPIYESRIDDLLQINARVRWVSAEPLLGELSLAPWLGPLDVSWVVAGPELGEHARPCHSEWMRKIAVECTMAKVPFFTKHLLDGEAIREYPDGQEKDSLPGTAGGSP